MNVPSTRIDSIQGERHSTFKSFETCNIYGAPTAETGVMGTRLDKSQGRSPRGKTGIDVTICRRCNLSVFLRKRG